PKRTLEPQNPRTLDHMERPTSALHLTRVTLTVRALNAEPHTKEVGHDAVYNHHCLRSPRGHDGRGRSVAGAPDPCAPRIVLGHPDDSAVRRPAAAPGTSRLLL